MSDVSVPSMPSLTIICINNITLAKRSHRANQSIDLITSFNIFELSFIQTQKQEIVWYWTWTLY